MGRSPSFEDCLKPGPGPAQGRRRRRRRARIVDVAQGLEGIVRNNSIHAAAVVIADRPLHEIVPLQLAEDRGAPRREGRERQARAPVQDRHPVLDGPDRGDRPAEDGLPRPAQPRRDRGRGRDHPPLARGRGRHGVDPARRREDLRDARPRRLGRRLPARVRGDARGAASKIRPTEFDDIVALGLALPARARCATSPTTRAASATPRSVTYPDPRLRPITEDDLRLLHLPGAADGDREADRPASRPAEADDLRKAVGKKKRDLMATMEDKFIDGLRRLGHRAPRSPRTSGR